jgi:PhzF family phenazine biosynthesis protein
VAELEVLKVDTFTDELFSGNPAAVVFDADGLDDVQMQRVAMEVGLRSTVFVLKSKKADIRLRFFMPACEMPVCGHATLGALWSLVERGTLGGVLGGRHRVETPVGVFPFWVEERPEVANRIWITQKKPLFARVEDLKEVASALGIGVDSMFHEEFPLCRASTGLPTLLVPVRSLGLVGRLDPRPKELAELAQELEVDAVSVYSWEVLDHESTLHSRCYGLMPEVYEDPASAMPAGALGAYIAENDFVGRDVMDGIVVEQGHWMGRESRIIVRIEKRGPSIRKVEVGGSAVISMRGRMSVP